MDERAARYVFINYSYTGTAIPKYSTGDYYEAIVTKNVEYQKGRTKLDDVSSTIGSTFPEDGKKGEFWYVYKGVW